MSEELRVCNDCGCIIELWDGYNDPDGSLICEDCFNETYYECEHCRRVVYQDDIVEINDGELRVCDDCSGYYYECNDCGGYFTWGRMRETCTGTNVCSDCQENYYICDNCGYLVHEDDIYNSENGYIYCASCYDRDIIKDHDYKPDPVFLGGRATGYYGIELEIDDGDDRTDCAREIMNICGDKLYCKYDGSLNRGFEIVTHPATIDYHIHEMGWDKIIDIALKYGFRSHDTTTCGLHIHASRTLFGQDRTLQDLTIAKVILLVDKHFDSIILPFSRRTSDRLREWARKPNANILEYDSEQSAIRKGRDTEYNGRYQAVNLTNRNTVEFRFFRGTLNLETLFAALQFIDFIIEYSSNNNLKDVCIKDFRNVLQQQATGYLKDYLIQRNIIKKEEEKTICV